MEERHKHESGDALDQAISTLRRKRRESDVSSVEIIIGEEVEESVAEATEEIESFPDFTGTGVGQERGEQILSAISTLEEGVTSDEVTDAVDFSDEPSTVSTYLYRMCEAGILRRELDQDNPVGGRRLYFMAE